MIEELASSLKELRRALGVARYNAILSEDTPIGLEVELANLPSPEDIPKMKAWKNVEDGSIKDNGREFVSKILQSKGEVRVALKELTDYLKTVDYKVTGNCSVHVHVQVSHLTVEQLITSLCWYYIFERQLFKFASVKRYRYKNRFTVSWEDSLCIYDILKGDVPSNHFRYSALNLAAIQKFGTVEFRQREGTGNYHRLLEWSNLCRLMVDSHEVPHDIFTCNLEEAEKDIFKQYHSLLVDNTPEKEREEDLIISELKRDELKSITADNSVLPFDPNPAWAREYWNNHLYNRSM